MPSRGLVERVAIELRQIDAVRAAAACGVMYPLTAKQTWARAQDVLRDGYRRDARRIVKLVRRGTRMVRRAKRCDRAAA